MKHYIELFGREIPIYGLMFYAGIAFAAIAAAFLCSKKRVEKFDLAGSGVYTMIGAVIGSKLLFILVSWQDIIKYNLSFISIIKGGFVFYGGLLGGILGLWIYSRQFKMSFSDFANLYATVLPLGHAFGRVGCFFAGCCYGLPYDGKFSVTYTDVVGITPTMTPLFPIQLVEAAALLLLFVIFLILYLKSERLREHSAVLYIIAYSILRFVIEFFRGDTERGLYGGLSTSQWVSVALFIFASAVLFIRFNKEKKKNKNEAIAN